MRVIRELRNFIRGVVEQPQRCDGCGRAIQSGNTAGVLINGDARRVLCGLCAAIYEYQMEERE